MSRMHEVVRRAGLVVALALSAVRPTTLSAQPPVAGRAVIITEPDDRAGPRFGAAYLTRGSETARNEGRSLYPLTTLVGWQIEHPFDLGEDFPPFMTEFVVLVGGLEQNVFLPSATWLFAFRQTNGVEFGFGPSVNASGTQFAIAAGLTHRFSKVNVPVNVAVAPARVGVAVSVTAGLNVRR